VENYATLKSIEFDLSSAWFYLSAPLYREVNIPLIAAVFHGRLCGGRSDEITRLTAALSGAYTGIIEGITGIGCE
jgi:hypothetical protein|tara:strand:- start:476 stop:700 length:225 start_codon:yes stop_codon:yes gene_type:complete